ncbi:MAG: glycosyltransferase family 4 protein [Chloroflexi bacterium]|nr:glycosyltransferase family 4 protein [Chloroflexota bacterium]
MKPIRICRVIARMNGGGPALHLIQLASGLDARRYEQLAVAGVEGPGETSMVPAARARGLALRIIPELGRELNARHDLVALWKLYRLFRRWRPDIVETHTAKAGTLGRLAAFLAGVPVRVHVFHGHVLHGYFSPRKTRAFVEIERGLARISTRIVSLGDVQRREILDYGISTPEKVVSIPLGFELAPFLRLSPGMQAAHAAALRAELGLDGADASPATPLLGIVARLVPIKAHEVFLDAAARILERVPLACFVIAGDGECRAALEARAAQPPLAGSVHFVGWRSDMPALYAGLDLVLLTSDNEGMPTSIIEAMAAGKPVVATDVGGVRSLVANAETGCLVPARNPDAVADACVRLLKDTSLRQRMGEAARRAVYPRYDVSTLLRTMDGFYTALVYRTSQSGHFALQNRGVGGP